MKKFNSRLCHACEDVDSVLRTNNIENSDSFTRLIRDQVTFLIINDSVATEVEHFELSSKEWNSNYVQTLKNLVDIDQNGICMFETNINAKNAEQVVTRLANEPDLKAYVHWEFCTRKSRRHARKFYQRYNYRTTTITNFPHRLSILPAMLETTRSSWFLISRNNYSARTWKTVCFEIFCSITLFYSMYRYHQLEVPKY